MNSSWVTTLNVIRHLGKFSFLFFISFVNFRANNLVFISYLFPPTVVLRTLFLILNVQNLHWNIIGVIINKFPTTVLYLVVLY